MDEDLLRRSMALAQGGDKAAYRLVLDASRTWLTRFFARRIAPAMVDDLVQETLLSMHAKRATFDSERSFLPWLSAIARYRWIDALRRTRAFEELEEDSAVVAGEEDEVLARLSLARLLNSLSPAQSNAIVLTRIEGKSVAEAAQICGQSETLVKVNVHRGLRKLASLIESE
ncbi:sigma-70 family RNA polymerase sigma factor [Sphingomonas rosea]|jgi:RNA polymerase sigma factor (sigma-70 family)|uniref:Sigma-70 family RNA polymerase sigma factor n=1 Tax=Sphingomonas rosea TaxID=335605 RepID=A0ABP7U440_9SPHN